MCIRDSVHVAEDDDEDEEVVDRERLLDDVRAEELERVHGACLLYTSPSPRDRTRSRMPSSA